MIQKLVVFCALLLTLTGAAQDSSPENGPLFLQNEIARIDVSIHQDTLLWILDEDNIYSDTHHSATFVYTTLNSTDTIENVGFRLKGNTSREAEKKSFKISFNAFLQGGSFMGVEKINLNGEHNDVSLLRSKCNWDLIQEANVIGSRSSYVELYINDEYRGLYLNIEHIDEEFIDKRFNANSGNLYKCHYSANLSYLGNNPDNYKLEPWGTRVYELKTNEEIDDYSDLAHFIDVLNNSSNDQFECRLEQVFNVNAFLKTAAIEILIGHWDGYLYNMNNYYLYHNPSDGLFYYISYDLDNTLGIDWLGENWANKNIYSWNDNSRPLIDELLERDTYRNQFSFYINQFLNSTFEAEAFTERANNLQGFISEKVALDGYSTLDYGFSFTDFEEAVSEAWGEHIDYGISEYVSLRSAFAMEQLEDFEDQVIFAQPELLFNENHPAFFETNFADEVEVEYQIDNEQPILITLFDNGTLPDQINSDGRFTFALNPSGNQIIFRGRAKYGNEWTEWTCDISRWLSKQNNGLVINELMARNESTVADEFGEYNDWIELYNGSNQAVSLGNKYLSNNIDELNKWPLPSVTLEAGEFILLWLDDDYEQGYTHGNFNLEANGDDVYLSTIQAGSWRMIDCISFDGLGEDQVLARETDAGQNWVSTVEATPGASNNSTEILPVGEMPVFTAGPVPSEGLVYFSHKTSGRVMNITGKTLLTFENTREINIEHFNAGVYLLQTPFGTFRMLKI